MPNAQGGGFSWLLPLQDGAPPIGWADAIAYLSLPVLLVASQFVSQKLISPPQSNDPSQQSSQWILKFLPFMIGEQLHQQCPCVCTLVGSGGCCGLWWLRNLLFCYRRLLCSECPIWPGLVLVRQQPPQYWTAGVA
jgi:hypothetical protein